MYIVVYDHTEIFLVVVVELVVVVKVPLSFVVYIDSVLTVTSYGIRIRYVSVISACVMPVFRILAICLAHCMRLSYSSNEEKPVTNAPFITLFIFS